MTFESETTQHFSSSLQQIQLNPIPAKEVESSDLLTESKVDEIRSIDSVKSNFTPNLHFNRSSDLYINRFVLCRI